METTENENFDSNILIEAKLLEQEHRPTHLVLNYLNRKKKFPDENDPRRKAVQRAIIWRLFFSPAMLAVGGSTTLGIITAFILWNQTDIFEKQTDIFKEQTNIINEQKLLLEDQNKKIEIQARLEDANRRNNLVFLMDNVLNRVHDELKDSTNKDSTLSKPLLARIQALGQGFQPYKYINYELKDSKQRDSLGLTKLLSPERGQLLLSLANSDIGEKTMLLICKNTPFNRAYLQSARLNGAYLREANLFRADLSGKTDLSGADLRYANLVGANLSGADLSKKADLSSADLRDAKLTRADMRDVDLTWADLTDVDLIGADLRDAILNRADLTRANLTGVFLTDADLQRAILADAVLKNADLSGKVDLRAANLTGADLTGAYLTDANLTWADLIEANLRKADLRGTILKSAKISKIKSMDSCKVHRKDWLVYIKDSLKLEGADILQKKYKIVEYEIPTYKSPKKGYMLVKK